MKSFDILFKYSLREMFGIDGNILGVFVVIALFVFIFCVGGIIVENDGDQKTLRTFLIILALDVIFCILFFFNVLIAIIFIAFIAICWLDRNGSRIKN
jgi:hypothetical protein